MGWKDISPGRATNGQASPAQRGEITRLREQLDGMMPGTYAADKLPPYTKFEAIRAIDDLKAKIAKRKGNKSYGCPLCGRPKPCRCPRSAGR